MASTIADSVVALCGDTILHQDADGVTSPDSRGSLLVTAGISQSETRYLRGYNTHTEVAVTRAGEAGKTTTVAIPCGIVASVSGVLQLTGTVVSIGSMPPRYMAEVGDVVVGRINEVNGARWKCNISGLQDAVMQLNNVTEPGGILRRRGRQDELSMRNIFQEDDVFVAEVQRVSNTDGTVNLHTRSVDKYGRMGGVGTLVEVKPSLVPQTKRQFHTFLDTNPAAGALHSLYNNHVEGSTSAGSDEPGINVVFGVNGGIWIAAATPSQVAQRRLEMIKSETEEEEGLHANLRPS